MSDIKSFPFLTNDVVFHVTTSFCVCKVKCVFSCWLATLVFGIEKIKSLLLISFSCKKLKSLIFILSKQFVLFLLTYSFYFIK